jgi:hypothetical protein
MTDGYIEMAAAFDSGARENRNDPAPFRHQMLEYRKAGGQMALRFAEKYNRFGKLPGDTVALVFGLPRGSAGEIAQLTKVYKGMMPLAADIEAMQARSIEKGVLQVACNVSAAPNDSAKAQALLKVPDATVPLDVFQFAMAAELQKSAELFSRDKLDDPRKLENLCQLAQTALKGVPESKGTKDLSTKIENILKKLNKKS